MKLVAWRKSVGLSQGELASRVGLRSKGQISDIERNRQPPSAQIAIEIDRLSAGQVPVAELRPDLHDVRVVRAPAGHSGASA